MISKTILILAVIHCISAEYKIVFEDNFDGNSLNENNWKYETGGEPKWGNAELQYYTEHKTKNVRVENGHLAIEAHPENVGGKHFTSGRLNSKHAWTYGKFECRAKLPKGKGLWPAIWLLPKDEAYGGDSPVSGEIDIMEARGERSDTVEATLHYGGPYPNNTMDGSDPKKWTSDLSKAFHTYTLEWDKNAIRWSIDGKEYYHVSNLNRMLWSGKGKNPYTKPGQPFDKPFYWILNVAVGGNFFPVDPFGPQVTPAEAKHWEKPSMEIDFIRVYQK